MKKKSRKIKPFFNGLNGKFHIVIKVWSRVRFWRGHARFHTQSILCTSGPTFLMFQVVKLSFEVAFLNSATKCPINAKMTQNDTKVKIKKSMKSHWFDMEGVVISS